MYIVSFTLQPLYNPGIESRWGRDFAHPSIPPWGPQSLLYNRYRVFFSGVKRPGRGVDHPRPSNAEVKERVELYLNSFSGPSWSILGRTLPLSYTLNERLGGPLSRCGRFREQTNSLGPYYTSVQNVAIDGSKIATEELCCLSTACSW